MQPIDRRTFLKISTAGIVGVHFLPLVGGCEDYLVTATGNSSAPFLTPVESFFVQNGGEGSISGWSRPAITRDNWHLKITQRVGASTTELASISFDDLMAMRASEIVLLKTIQCVLESPLKTTPTGFMGTGYWTGLPLSAVLNGLQLPPTTRRLLFFGADGFYNNITVDRLTNGASQGLAEPLLAYEQNGRPLTDDHGFPVRLIMQEGFGYKNVKWLTEVQAFPFDLDTLGTYQQQGFVDDGIIRVNSRAVNVRDAVRLSAGPVAILGYAVSGYAPVTRIDVAVDGTAPIEADLIGLREIEDSIALPPTIAQLRSGEAFPFRAVWTPWRFMWEANPGRHTISVRATDAAGNIQPINDASVFDGNNAMAVYNVEVV